MRMRVFCENVSQPEGPVSLEHGHWAVTDMKNGSVSRISANGTTRHMLADTGRPNGLAIDGANRLWVAESKYPALLTIGPDNTVTTITTGSADLPFLWPNDLCFGPDGAVYLTDSGLLVSDMADLESPAAAFDLAIDGRVFRYDPASDTLTVLDRGLRFTNGIAFGLDGASLYVSETMTGNIYRYPIQAGQVQGERELFNNVMPQPPESYGRVTGPDGMAFDRNGNLYVAVYGQGNITVLGPDGSVTQRLPLDGDCPTNIAFIRTGEYRALITEVSRNQLIMLETPTAGAPLIYP
ncbi:MAG: SMP-30/gluconolactonase/LRE family protein [Anaerolineae bacterium]|nr:SMP-30/gluconolactonase/LRE family protein [Anaerolineae bacterium]